MSTELHSWGCEWRCSVRLQMTRDHYIKTERGFAWIAILFLHVLWASQLVLRIAPCTPWAVVRRTWPTVAVQRSAPFSSLRKTIPPRQKHRRCPSLAFTSGKKYCKGWALNTTLRDLLWFVSLELRWAVWAIRFLKTTDWWLIAFLFSSTQSSTHTHREQNWSSTVTAYY